MSEEEMLATLKEIHESGHRIADERDRLRAVNAALVEALERLIPVTAWELGEGSDAYPTIAESRAALAHARAALKGEKT